MLTTNTNTSETVIRHIYDENGNIVLHNAVIERTINERIIGCNGVLTDPKAIVIESGTMLLQHNGYTLPITILKVLSRTRIYTMWIVKMLPWTGRIHHRADGLFYMSDADGQGNVISTLLSAGADTSYWAYIQLHGTELMYLVKLRKTAAGHYKMFHPDVSNTNNEGIACVGGHTLKHKLSSSNNHNSRSVLTELFFNKFNADWTQPSVKENNLFDMGPDGQPQHIYVQNRNITNINQHLDIPNFQAPACPIYKADAPTAVGKAIEI